MKTTLLTIIGIFLFHSALEAQLPLRHRDPNNCRNLIVEGLSQLPPLTSDMPFDVLVSWIVLDSVCKSISCEERDAFLASTSDDTIRLAMKYYFTLSDYNDLLLSKYSFSLVERGYRCGPPMKRLFAEYEKRFGMSYMMMDVLYHSRIFVGTVEQVWEFPDTVGQTPVRGFCASMTIDEIVKGQTQYDECQENPESERCAIVAWMNSDEGAFRKWSRVFPPSTLEAGKRYLLFMYDYSLEQLPALDRYLTTLYPLFKEGIHGPMTYGTFEIQNGLVNDRENYFGMGNNPSYQDVLGSLREVIDTLYNR